MCPFSTVRRRLLFVFAAFAALVLRAPHAEAHAIGISTGEYVVRGASVVGKLAFARAEVAGLLPGLDTNHDGHLTANEIESARSVLRDKVLVRIVVSASGARCAAVLTDAALTELDGLLLSARWDCKTFDAPFDIDFAILDDLGRSHRHVARTVTPGATHDEVLSKDSRRIVLQPEAIAPSAAGAPVKASPSFGAFVAMGFVHILEGADHLVFLFGLLLARARFRSLVAVVTAFTVAHSITLAIAALGVWTPSPRIVEPAIGLTIAYVGIENFFVNDARRRWRITFPFGLVHGFGFASALREVALTSKDIPVALVSFNVGVELGQLAVLAALVPIVRRLHDRPWFERWGRRAASGVVVALGVVWFVVRVSGR